MLPQQQNRDAPWRISAPAIKKKKMAETLPEPDGQGNPAFEQKVLDKLDAIEGRLRRIEGKPQPAATARAWTEEQATAAVNRYYAREREKQKEAANAGA